MTVSLIVAMDQQRGIGLHNALPWKLKDDLKMFKERTMGHHIIMGRKTYDSIGRPLPGRTSLIVSRDPNYSAPGCTVLGNPQDAIRAAKEAGDSECFVIGGAELYRQMLALCDRLYISQVHASCQCDAFFPDVPLFNSEEWSDTILQEFPQDERNEFAWTLHVLDRR